MRSRDVLVRSARRSLTPGSRLSYSPVAAAYSCPRCFSATAADRFSASQSSQFAFKWFRRPKGQVEEKQDAWQQVITRYRVRGDLSAQQVKQFLEVLEDNPELPWLSYKDAITTLEIALRSDSDDHYELASRLYVAIQPQSEKSVSGKSISKILPASMPDLIRALAMRRYDQEAMSLCRDASEGHRQPLILWKGLLEAYRDQGDLIGFLKARDSMMMSKLEPDVNILNLQLELLNTSRLYQDAEMLYNAMPKDFQVSPNWQTRLIMLDTCMNQMDHRAKKGAHDNISLGQELFRRINQSDLQEHGDEAYPKLLSWIVFNDGKMDAIHNKVNEMQKAGHDLDINVVNAMLYTATIAKKWLFVERLWNSLRSTTIYPDNHTFSLRIAASVMAGDTNEAKSIFEKSQTAGFSDMIDPLALQTLLASEMMGEQSDDALCDRILQLLENRQPFPITPTSLMFLIPKLIEKKKFARLEHILEMSQNRSDWDTRRTIDSIVEEVSSAKDGKAVWNIFVLLKNLFWDDPLYDLECRKILLRRLIKLEAPQMVGSMFTQYLSSKIKPDDRMYIMLLQGGGMELRDYDLIRKIHQAMKMDMNISEHTAVLNTLMNAYAHVNSTLAFDIWEQIAGSGRGPSHASVSIILDGCTFLRLPVKGQYIWRTLERRNFQFNDNNFASYVEMLNKHNLTDAAFSILSLAIKEGKDVGERAVSTLYNTSARKDDVAVWAKSECPKLWNTLSSTQREGKK